MQNNNFYSRLVNTWIKIENNFFSDNYKSDLYILSTKHMKKVKCKKNLEIIIKRYNTQLRKGRLLKVA